MAFVTTTSKAVDGGSVPTLYPLVGASFDTKHHYTGEGLSTFVVLCPKHGARIIWLLSILVAYNDHFTQLQMFLHPSLLHARLFFDQFEFP